jgi:NAD(P)-dependent dehydrogenase (short-subunit alcohol dehydrogenase family)
MRKLDAMKASTPLKFIASGIAAATIAQKVVKQMRTISFRDKVVAITGGSRGLGLVLAREFSRRGARVAICARATDELSRAESEFRVRGEPILALECDVTKADEVKRFVERVRAEMGEIDVLVNNAGVISVGPQEDQVTEAFEKALNTHFWGPYFMISAVLPAMIRRRQGRIVNIASIGGKVAVPHLLPYAVSKFALVGYSEGLRAELLKDGVLVTTVCPGLMRTGSPRNAEFVGDAESEYAWFKVSGSLPFVSVSARSAARQIVAACARGDAELKIGIAARLGALFHGIASGTLTEIMGVVNRMLPGSSVKNNPAVKGSEVPSAISESPATLLTQVAELENNER